MNVVGVDLSLTATGIARPDGSLERLPCGTRRDVHRLDWIRCQIHALARTGVDLVAIEGFSYGSKGSAVDEIYGAGWIVRLQLHHLNVPYADIPPATLKKYATGKGNATKPDMRMALFQRAGLDERDDNLVDAWWLRAMALDHYGQSVLPMPATHRAAFAKVAWPEFEAVA